MFDIIDDALFSLRYEVLPKVVNPLIDGIEATGRGIDKAVNVVVIDGIAGSIDKAVEFAQENPGKAACVAAATVATGGIALAGAGPIAATIGATGALGTAGTGTAISTLSGAALTNASLAALGGGTLAAGGGGMAAGTAVVAGVGTAAGAAGSAGVVAATS